MFVDASARNRRRIFRARDSDMVRPPLVPLLPDRDGEKTPPIYVSLSLLRGFVSFVSSWFISPRRREGHARVAEFLTIAGIETVDATPNELPLALRLSTATDAIAIRFLRTATKG